MEPFLHQVKTWRWHDGVNLSSSTLSDYDLAASWRVHIAISGN